MPFVQRDEDGNIKGVYACLQPGYAEEEVPEELAVLPPRVIDTKQVVDAVFSETGNIVRALSDALLALTNEVRALKSAEPISADQFKADLVASVAAQKVEAIDPAPAEPADPVVSPDIPAEPDVPQSPAG